MGFTDSWGKVDGLYPRDGDIEELRGPANVPTAKQKCEQHTDCIGFTFHSKDKNQTVFYVKYSKSDIRCYVVYGC